MTCEYFRDILKICPKLEKLAVSNVDDPAEWELMDVYNNSRCQNSSLQIVDFQPNDCTVEFIEMLQNTRSAAAIKLRELTLGSEDFERDMLKAFLDMLEVNTTLESLQLTAHEEFEEEFEEEFGPLFRSFNGQLLPGKVPQPCHYALLSVIKRLGGQERTVAKRKKAPARKRACVTRKENVDHFNGLGQDVLEQIFKFAEEPRVRKVYVHWSDHDIFGWFERSISAPENRHQDLKPITDRQTDSQPTCLNWAAWTGIRT